MAKKKYNGLSSKHFFNIVVLSASALGLMLAVFVVQSPTSTRSNAAEIAATCSKKPILVKDGVVSGSGYVTYKYKVKNPNPSGCPAIYYAFYMTKPSSAWFRKYSLNGGSWISEYDNPGMIISTIKSGSTPHSVRARIEPGEKSGSFPLTAYACQAINSGDGAGPDPRMNCDTKQATYLKD